MIQTQQTKTKKNKNMTKHGLWVPTYSGRRLYPMNPRPEDVYIADIAHAISNQARYAGHTRHFYSTAEHSVRLANMCSPQNCLWGLLHDASEAYCVDLPRPVKRVPEIREAYGRVEEAIMKAVCDAFGLGYEMPEEVKKLDDEFTWAEIDKAFIFPENASANCAPPRTLNIKIGDDWGWTPDQAKTAFIDKFVQCVGLAKWVEYLGKTKPSYDEIS